MNTIITSIMTTMSQPGTKTGLIVGAILSPILLKMVSPILGWVTKYVLSATAKITPIVAQGTKTACIWAFSFPMVRAVIAANPKACETLIDTVSNCLSAIILTVQVTVDAQIAAAGLQQAPDAPK